MSSKCVAVVEMVRTIVAAVAVKVTFVCPQEVPFHLQERRVYERPTVSPVKVRVVEFVAARA
jgi:hypothetical protein